MTDVPEQTFVELEAGSEWRFELEGEENIAVRVSAESCFTLPTKIRRYDLQGRSSTPVSLLTPRSVNKQLIPGVPSSPTSQSAVILIIVHLLRYSPLL